MHFKKYMKLESIKNISSMVVSDIEIGRNVQKFDINNLNDLLTFEQSRIMNKAFYTDNLLLLKFQLMDIERQAKKDIKFFMRR